MTVMAGGFQFSVFSFQFSEIGSAIRASEELKTEN